MTSTVLIIDDDPTALMNIEAILEERGYHLETASSGPEGLEKAAALLPDLILLDVMMPGMDGFEVCRRMRSTSSLAEVPIVILTALEDRFFLLRGTEAGADDFISKPVDRQELLARVRTITRLNRYRTLLEQRENLRQMAGRVVAAQEDERKKISRELHDELGQALTAHNLKLHELQRELPGNMSDLLQQVNLLISETSEILNKTRLIAQDLRPPLLDTLDLQLALSTCCLGFSSRAHIPVHFEIDPALPLLADLYAVILYRILQETLTNVIKHAQATQVWVDLAQEDDWLNLTVQDNGQGFPAEKSETGGIGLIGIRERLALVGGYLNIRSSPNQGSVISASLPLNSAALMQQAET
jgi:signal transduction histidine kinase